MPTNLVGIELFGVVIVISIGLFVTLARKRLRSLQEIRASVENLSGVFSAEHGDRDTAAFGLEGKTLKGVPWTLRTGGPGEDSGCRLELTFPTLCGDSDLVVVPRDQTWESAVPTHSMLDAREFPSGLADFDAAYKVLVPPRQMSIPPLNPALAERFVKWPGDTAAPNPVAAWRDESGFHVEAHLSRMSWASVEHLLNLGEDMCERLPVASF